MPVVDVGVMRVAVGDRRMCVLMRMRLAAIPRKIVRVLVVHVVHVAVGVGGEVSAGAAPNGGARLSFRLPLQG